MTPGYAIRLARPSELEVCSDIERRAGARFFDLPGVGAALGAVMSTVVTPEAEFLRGLEERGLFVAVIEATDQPVGFSLVTRLDADAHLVELDVVPEHGRLGLGRSLVIAALAWGVERELRRMTLSTLEFVPWNGPFYARLGFRPLEAEEVGSELRATVLSDLSRGLPDDGRVLLGRALPSRR